MLISYTHSRILIHVYSFINSFTYTHSRILIHIFIHVLISYTHSHIQSCAHFIYSFTYTHSWILIHKFIYIYSFTYTHSCILIHILLSLNESILLRNWNQSNRIIQNKVMAFSCQLVNLPITLGTVYITHFSGILTSCLTLYLCTILKLRC